MKDIQKKKFITTDGSPTFYLEKLDEYYHSKHGALQEANHVYIQMGLRFWVSQQQNLTHCTVFEMGFGTGLNAVLTILEAQKMALPLSYNTIEAYPLSTSDLNEIDQFNYYPEEEKKIHLQLHSLPWEVSEKLSDTLSFKKYRTRLQDFIPDKKYDVIYYDAFGARAQPELWEDQCFTALVERMNPGGVLVTYSAKGSVRRALQRLGLEVVLIQGPPGKREMIRGVRPHL